MEVDSPFRSKLRNLGLLPGRRFRCPEQPRHRQDAFRVPAAAPSAAATEKRLRSGQPEFPSREKQMLLNASERLVVRRHHRLPNG